MTDASVIVLGMFLIPLLIIAIVVTALRLRSMVKRDQKDDPQS